MAPTYKHKCANCGRMHMRHKEICWECEKSISKEDSGRVCALCGNKIIRSGRGESSSPYCSSQCSRAVGKARAMAIQIVSKSVRIGEMKKAKQCECVDCGKPAIDYDHREYLKPLSVVPVCRSCNLKRGPATDIKEAVARHLNIPTEEIRSVIDKEKSEWQRQYEQLFGGNSLRDQINA